jgi:hypothetical protein
LDQQHAWEFVRRPVDVTELVSYWQDKGRLGSLTELIEHDLQTKLRETTARENLDPLDEKQAREGAEALAAAVVFCRQFSFRIRDDAHLPNVPGLEARSCLPEDWRPDQCRALLSRALFDSASYGCIRFHHRRIAEYLAAQWMTKRMQEACPLTELEHLFVAQVGGRRLIRPAVAPVVAWLSYSEEDWSKEVRQ